MPTPVNACVLRNDLGYLTARLLSLALLNEVRIAANASLAPHEMNPFLSFAMTTKVLRWSLPLFLFSACSLDQEVPTSAAGAGLSVRAIVRATVPAGPLSIEDEFRIISESEPNFAGIYLDDDFVPVVVAATGALSPQGSALARSRVAARSGAIGRAAACEVDGAES